MVNPISAEDFLGESLDDIQSISDSEWTIIDPNAFPGFQPKYRVVNASRVDASPMEVAFGVGAKRPTADDLRRLWRERGLRTSGFVVVVLHDGKAFVAGPSQDDPVVMDAEVSVVENVCVEVLRQEEHNAAAQRAREMLSALNSAEDAHEIAVYNAGLFANHQVLDGMPAMPEWKSACDRGVRLSGLTGKNLLYRLGFDIEPSTAPLDLLTAADDSGGVKVMAALLNSTEQFETSSSRFQNEAPVVMAQRVARERGIPWVIAMSGRRIRLYPTDPSQTLARGGLADRFVQVDLAMLDEGNAGYLPLFFSAEAFAVDGSVARIRRESQLRAIGLLDRLKERIYADVIPGLSVGVAEAMGAESKDELDEAYRRSLVILFRMIFLAYAEHEGLLPLHVSEAYAEQSVAALARELTDDPDSWNVPGGSRIWERVQRLWHAVDQGDPVLGVPAYNGGLFSEGGPTSDEPWPESFVVRDDAFAPALTALLVDESGDERGPVDFRSLDVTAFGTLYEGLLESELSRAELDLTLKKSKKGDVYVPAPAGMESPEVKKGEVYFHTASGERKATGSYFTPTFAVEYLLDRNLEPALEEHLAQVRALAEDGASSEHLYAKLFDFRVIDPAMGSGHFLVAAVDRIGRAFQDFLAEHEIPSVIDELDRLHGIAEDALAGVGITVEDLAKNSKSARITAEAILRRQIARRCIYGIELNDMAAELARLAIWIRTFVPGLPMSSMRRNLVHGNSLVGITRIDEAVAIIDPVDDGEYSLFGEQIAEALGDAGTELARLALASDATIAEIQDAEQERLRVWESLTPVRDFFDAALYRMLFADDPFDDLDDSDGSSALKAGLRSLDIGDIRVSQKALAKLEALRRLHLPLAFPEVMSRERPGFDVVVGNPPWEKVKVEEHSWWTVRVPGLRSMTQADKNATIARYKEERKDLFAAYRKELELTDEMRRLFKNGPYTLGAGDTDLYKLFCWRDWDLARERGRVGIVIPRAALSGAGTQSWRGEVLGNGSFEDVCTAVNNGGWMFDGVHPQFTIALASLRKGDGDRVRFHGPYYDRASFDAMVTDGARAVSASEAEFASWSTSLAFPLLPSAESAELFAALRISPPFAEAPVSRDFRFVTELHTSAQKEFYDFDLDHPRLDLPVMTGRSFNLWAPDFGPKYAYADRDEIVAFLQARRRKQIRRADGAFNGFDLDWAEDSATLPMNRPRIAFRDVARATDSRTFIVCLIPGNAAVVEKSPYLFNRSGCVDLEALMLGVLGSRSFDWGARRYVENKVSLGVLSNLPFPNVNPDGKLEKKLIENSGRLAAVDDRYAEWAGEVGVPVGSVDDGEKQSLIEENEAIVAHLYGLTREQLTVLYATFHRGWDYRDELDRVLVHFDALVGVR